MSLKLPPELWDSIFKKLFRMNIKLVLKIRNAIPYFKSITYNNKEIRYKLTLFSHAKTLNIFKIFLYLCENCHLMAAKWLVENFILKEKKVKKKDNLALFLICGDESRYKLRGISRLQVPEKTRLEFLQWFIEKFNFTLEETC